MDLSQKWNRFKRDFQGKQAVKRAIARDQRPIEIPFWLYSAAASKTVHVGRREAEKTYCGRKLNNPVVHFYDPVMATFPDPYDKWGFAEPLVPAGYRPCQFCFYYPTPAI